MRGCKKGCHSWFYTGGLWSVQLSTKGRGLHSVFLPWCPGTSLAFTLTDGMSPPCPGGVQMWQMTGAFNTEALQIWSWVKTPQHSYVKSREKEGHFLLRRQLTQQRKCVCFLLLIFFCNLLSARVSRVSNRCGVPRCNAILPGLAWLPSSLVEANEIPHCLPQ